MYETLIQQEFQQVANAAVEYASNINWGKVASIGTLVTAGLFALECSINNSRSSQNTLG